MKGISTCQEPMLWHPDEGHLREPCLVLDTARIEVPIHIVDSSEAFHLTKQITRARRTGEDVEPIINEAYQRRRYCLGVPDEFFVEGAIHLDAVIALGFEHDDAKPLLEVRVKNAANDMGVPVLDMTGWSVGYPGCGEVDEIVRSLDMRREHHNPPPYP